ncbi:MAG: TlpA family protein disulfide reductase, partial [Dehalococcoidia bacterium]|nr:TlpA family protein disulfide reductase [Dehalococcoidia bacterium]
TLTDLEADTTYYFRVKSKDASGNEAISDQTFDTLPAILVGHLKGNRAPDFTLQNLDEDEVTLSDLRGKIVMLNFWFVACSPCAAEMPHIQAVSDTWSADELAILGVNRIDNADTIRSFVDSEELTFHALLDSVGAAHNLYNVNQVPTTFFIDTEGIIQKVQVGPFSSQEEIESILDSL